MGINMKVAVVCSSNQNRSMEAHNLLSKKGYNVESYGTGSVVKLPGCTADQPNVYAFGTTYEHMYQDLLKKDPQLYTQNGILHMLDRNRRIKAMPERFQETPNRFDIIFTTEERIYDAVVEKLESDGSSTFTPVHVLNIDIKDNHEEATLGAFLFLELCEMMKNADDLEDDMEAIIHDFEAKNNRTLLHSVHFY